MVKIMRDPVASGIRRNLCVGPTTGTAERMAAWLRGRSAGPGVRRLSLAPAAKHWNQLSESSPGPKGSQTVSEHSHASVLNTDAQRVPPWSVLL